MLSTRALTDETLRNMYYSFDELNCCVVCELFFSVVGFFVTTHWFGFEDYFNHIFIFCITISTFTLVSYILWILLMLYLLVFLKQVYISILTVILLFYGGCSDLVRFAFLILQLALCSGVVFCLEIYLIASVYESVVFSVVFIACGTFDIFSPFIYVTFLISSISYHGIALWV